MVTLKLWTSESHTPRDPRRVPDEVNPTWGVESTRQEIDIRGDDLYTATRVPVTHSRVRVVYVGRYRLTIPWETPGTGRTTIDDDPERVGPGGQSQTSGSLSSLSSPPSLSFERLLGPFSVPPKGLRDHVVTDYLGRRSYLFKT